MQTLKRTWNFKGTASALAMILAMLVVGHLPTTRSAPPPPAAPRSAPSAAAPRPETGVSAPVLRPEPRAEAEPEPKEKNPEESAAPAPESQKTEEKEKARRVYYDVPLSADLQNFIFSECASRGVPTDLVIALIGVESDFNPGLISKTNDYGLMQINLCHKEFLEKTLKITNLLDEKQNVQAGVYMLSGIIRQYENDNQALMVYNCGESGAKRLWKSGVYSTAYSRKVIAKRGEIKNARSA